MVDAAPHEEVADGGVIGRSAGAHLAAVTGYGAVGGGVGGLGVLVLGVIVSLVLDPSALGAGASALLVLYVAVPAVGLGMLFGTVTGSSVACCRCRGVGGRRCSRGSPGHGRLAWPGSRSSSSLCGVAASRRRAPGPGPNETMQHVIEDWALGVVGPGLAAGLATAWVARSLARPPRDTLT